MFRGKLVSILILLLGCGIAWHNSSSGQEVKKITRNGAEGTAITPDSYTRHRKYGITTSYTLNLSYVDADGKKQTVGHYTTSEETVEKFRRGQPVRVKYLPSDPKKAFIVGDESVQSGSGITWFAAIAMILIGGYDLLLGKKPEEIDDDEE